MRRVVPHDGVPLAVYYTVPSWLGKEPISSVLPEGCPKWAEYQLRMKRQTRDDATDAFNRGHYAGTKLRNDLGDGWNTIKPSVLGPKTYSQVEKVKSVAVIYH